MSRETGLAAAAKRLKIRVNSWCDRAIYYSDNYLRDAAYVANPILRKVVKWLAWRVGNLAWLLRDMPRLTAYELADERWTIRCIGWERDVQEVAHLFFPESEVTPREVARVALGQVGNAGRAWLADGVDLVISQLPLWMPLRPRSPIYFRSPTWIEQILTLTEDPWALVAGRSRHGLRSAVNRAIKQGYGYRFSQDMAEFDYFYERMYVPFVGQRHNDLAMLTSHRDMVRFWVRRGGVLFVTLGDALVAGTVVFMEGDVCHSVEGGVLDASPDLVRQGINAVADWFTIVWATAQGARNLFMGGSQAWASNGPYEYKERWGAHPVRRHRLYATWAFQGGDLSPEQCRTLNAMGFLVEEQHRYYRVVVAAADDGAGRGDDVADGQSLAQSAAQDAAGKGLAGVLFLKADGTREWVAGQAPAVEPAETQITLFPRAGQSARERRRARQNAAQADGIAATSRTAVPDVNTPVPRTTKP